MNQIRSNRMEMVIPIMEIVLFWKTKVPKKQMEAKKKNLLH